MIRRAKILDSEYRKDLNVIIWRVLFLENPDKDENEPQDLLEGETRTLIYRATDLMSALGVTSQVPPYMIMKFANDIKGKELNLDMRAQIANLDKEELEDMTDEDMQKLAGNTWHQYPFYEAYQIEQEKDGQ
jgi:hypothetical protein